PSSSQLVGYCSAPEFIHLLDVCLLEDTLPPSSLLVTSSEDSAFDDADEFEAQIWICTNQLSIMDCTEFGWLDHRVVFSSNKFKRKEIILGGEHKHSSEIHVQAPRIRFRLR